MDEQALFGVQPVLGLVEDDRVRPVHHRVGHLDAARGGEAVHEFHMRGRAGEQGFVDLIVRHERRLAIGNLAFLSDPPPEVGVDEIGIAHRGRHIVGDGERPAARFGIGAGDRLPRFGSLIAPRRGVGEVHPHLGANHHQRRADVGRVADEDDFQFVERLARWGVLDHREDVAHDLSGVIIVGETVDHRDGSVRCKIEHRLVLQRPCLDHVDHAADHLRGIARAFARAEMNLARLQIERVSAELGHRDFERDAGAGRGLLEDHAERGAREQLRAGAILVRLLEQADQVEDPQQLLTGKILRVDEMPERLSHDPNLRRQAKGWR